MFFLMCYFAINAAVFLQVGRHMRISTYRTQIL